MSEEQAGAFGTLWSSTINRMDALMNKLSRLGSKVDRTTQNEIQEQFRLSEVELEILYRTNHYAARIVNLLPDESTRRGFDVTISGSKDGSNPFQEEFDTLQLIEKLNMADKWSRLYGGGLLALGVDDGKMPSEPLDEDGLRKGEVIGNSLNFVHAMDRHEVQPGAICRDARSRFFGQPETYIFSPRSYQRGIELNPDALEISDGEVIHASRIIRFVGVELPTNIRSDVDWWGDPVLLRCFEALGNLGMMEKSMGNISQTFTQAVFKMQGLSKLAKAKGGEEELLNRFMAMNLSQSILSMMIIDADKESFERRSTNVTGLADLYDRIAQSFGAAAEMPLTLLFGTPPAGLSTDDKSGARNWENSVRAHQRIKYIPAINRLCAIMRAMKDGPKFKGDLEVEAVPLTEPSEEERSRTFKSYAESAAILIDRGVVTPTEVRNSYFGGAKFSPVIRIEQGPGADPNSTPQENQDDEQMEEAADIVLDGLTDEEIMALMSQPRNDEEGDEGEMVGKVNPRLVQYKNLAEGPHTCDRCAWFNPEGSCMLVAGPISGDGWCVLWGTRLLVKEDEDGFKPPVSVMRAAKRGLELRKKFGRGGTEVGIARARDLSNGKSVSLETIGRMVNFFGRHQSSKDTPPEEGNGKIAWLLWGGDPGRRWAESVHKSQVKNDGNVSPILASPHRFIQWAHIRDTMMFDHQMDPFDADRVATVCDEILNPEEDSDA